MLKVTEMMNGDFRFNVKDDKIVKCEVFPAGHTIDWSTAIKAFVGLRVTVNVHLEYCLINDGGVLVYNTGIEALMADRKGIAI